MFQDRVQEISQRYKIHPGLGLLTSPALYACVSRSVVSTSLLSPLTVAFQAPLSMGFTRQEYWSGVGCYFLLHGIFPTQGSNPGLSHHLQILYHLSHQGSPTNPLELTANAPPTHRTSPPSSLSPCSHCLPSQLPPAVSVMPSVGVMAGGGGNYEDKRIRGCRREVGREL